MNVLLLGANGQLGWEMERTCPRNVDLDSLGRDEADLSDPAALRAAVEEHEPDVIVNAAAYTGVDRSEQEEELALAVNGRAPGELAKLAAARGLRFVHVSTDFVFDGSAATPYAPDAATAPLGAYGRSKLAGEAAVRAAGGDWLIVRTAWLYSAHGNNFVKTMLRLMRERGAVRVVADQRGAPTWANGLAQALWTGISRKATGMHHWTDAGATTWAGFAQAIAEEGHELGLLEQVPTVTPITTAEYPTPARRPAYSVLDMTATAAAFGVRAKPWRTQLSAMLRETLELSDA